MTECAATGPASQRPDSLALDDQLCFAVYATANAYSRLYAALLSRLDLTYTQYLVMLVLWEGEGLTLKEIGARLRLDSGTLTPVLSRLDKRGLIVRQRDPADQRRITTHLTADGYSLRDRVAEARRQAFVATGLDPDELDRLKSELHAVRNAIDQAVEAIDRPTDGQA